ncbi:MAG: long-chain fatty acid--CoA ligase [Chloroflexi bacterium]|nr:long-chain fatty acid--CoA ligase [Chloroflexota bacterium]
MLNLSMVLENSAKEYPGNKAVIFNDICLNYAQVNGAANQFANVLRDLGVQPGEKVALMIPNIPYFPICYFGILKTGAIVVPLNVLFKAPEIEYHLEDSESTILVVWEGFVEEALKGFQVAETCRQILVIQAPGGKAEYPENVQIYQKLMAQAKPVSETHPTMPDDTAVILYTSGTTGRPKGAELTHFNMFSNAVYAGRDLLGVQPGDIALAVLPLFHSFGQTCVMNAGFGIGAGITLLPRFEPDKALAILERDGVNYFAGVPTMYWYLLNYPEAHKFNLEKIASNLRICASGGSALPVETMRAFEAKFNVQILEGYGLSETSPVASFNVRHRPRKPGSIGVPIWGVEMKIVDENDRDLPQGQAGEIVIRGHNVMKGYYQRPEATAEAIKNGWFHSGDIGYMDEDGYFFIVDRKKDMIIRGGFNIYPREVEDVLMGHPAVSMAAVLGVPHESLGEEVKAFIVLKAGQQASAEELIAYSKERLAAYKYPRTIEFRDQLPLNATGKILKRELRKM